MNRTEMSTMVDDIRDRAQELLCDLVAIPTTRGNERQGMDLLYERLRDIVDEVEMVELDDTLMDDPLYDFPVEGHSYRGSANLKCTIRGRTAERPVLFNTHMDVVPESEGQDDAFVPSVRDGVVHGRGACDAKGQIAVLYALALFYEQTGTRPPVDLVWHIVIEEEVGGNGTLALVRRGVDARAAIVLEPTDLDVLAAVRGAVWFRLTTRGRAGHSGSGGQRISALDTAIDAMKVLRAYHDALLSRMRGNPLFDVHADPMPITFGRASAGAWPASIPASATVEGVLGFLPPVEHAQVQREMREALHHASDSWLRENFELEFPMLNNDGYALPEDHPLVTGLIASLRSAGAPSQVRAMTASCDAWLYNNVAQVPTVVFGAGSLGDAHGKDEKVSLDDVITAATGLRNFVETFAA